MGKPGFPICSHQSSIREGHGETRFPRMFTLDAHARGAQRCDDHGASLGGPPPPWPSLAGGGNRAPPRREGDGETRFPHVPTAGGSGWRLPHRKGDGETRFPHMFTLDGHAHGAQHQNENPPGGEGLPPPQAGGWGNPVSPYFHISVQLHDKLERSNTVYGNATPA